MKRILFLFAYVILAFSAIAQCGPNWLNHSKSNSDTWFEDITTDSQNNIIIAGSFAQGNFNYQGILFTGNDISELVVLKSNPSGTVLWNKRFVSTAFPGSTEAYPTSVVTDAANNVYVIGYYQPSINFGTYTLTSAGAWDCFVVKLNGINGNVIWAKSFGSGSTDELYGIDCKNNLLYLTGMCTNANTSFGSFTVNPTGNEKAIVVKMDTAGTVLNAVSFGAAFVNGTKIMPGGDIVITASYGTNFTMGTTSVTANGFYDVLISRLDKNTLAPKWVKFGGSSFDEFVGNVDIDASANIYTSFAMSLSMTWGTQTLTTKGDKDVAYTKLDSSGTILWAKTFGGPSRDIAGDIKCSSNGFIVTANCSDSVQFPGGINLYNQDKGIENPLLAKFDSNGNYITHLLGNDTVSSSTFAPNLKSSLCIDNYNNIYWTDRVLNKISFLGFNTNLATSNNGFVNSYVLKVCETSLVSVNELSKTENKILLYPNPCSQKFTIESSSTIKKVVLYNELGQILNIQTISSGSKAEVTIAGLMSGIYFVEIVSQDNRVNRQKLLVE